MLHPLDSHTCSKRWPVVLSGFGQFCGEALSLCKTLNQHFAIVVSGKNVIYGYMTAGCVPRRSRFGLRVTVILISPITKLVKGYQFHFHSSYPVGVGGCQCSKPVPAHLGVTFPLSPCLMT